MYKWAGRVFLFLNIVLFSTVVASENVLANNISRAEFDWLMAENIVPAALAPQHQPRLATPTQKIVPLRYSQQSAITPSNSTMQRGLPYSVRELLQQSNINPATMSAFVLRVGDREPMMVYNENIPRTPASVMKILTTYAGLGVLGKNYRWPTEIYMQGNIRNGTLNGNLIVKGYGSPDFDNSDVREILRKVAQRGIRHFNGNLIFDNSYFQVANIDPGSFDGKPYETYNAQPDALMFQDRTSEFIVKNVGGRAKVFSSTPAKNVIIANNIRSVKSRCRGKARSPHMSISRQGADYIVNFSGRYSTRCGPRSYKKAITDPSNMLYSSLVNHWKRDVGGNINARFVMGTKPHNAQLIYRHLSQPLHTIIREVNKDSHNIMARQIMLSIAAKRLGAPANTHKGQQAINLWLRSVGLNFPELRIENGSGLSRWSKISSRHIGELLLHAYRSPNRQLLMNSLAVAGVDGTMRKRLRNTPIQGRGFFKTGTLRDTRAIAGYVRGHDGHYYIVSILQNDQVARRRGKAAHDALIRWAYWDGKPPKEVATLR
ncbi:MAG: D-alanyl-D-alanine carboxypeptidase (EC [uncultured Thiotrichaceae bacterium]|uniref:D-alanyl-D-alanine carboxypeptidase (EC) n=1 Tax=uncultured Thiotrichaceae bacterium TaxID=298394 RepID=A0A6S6U9Z7_9GAMM|nr:MAG: D-alanyl-D-alanine carboxypeptidase (EC [uncultured Thiotrichaceae bacterium]